MLTLKKARAEAKRKLDLIAGGGRSARSRQEAVQGRVRDREVVARRFIERHAKVNNGPGRRSSGGSSARSCRTGASARSRRITRRDVVALLDAIVDRGVPVTANRTLTVARKMFNWAIER